MRLRTLVAVAVAMLVASVSWAQRNRIGDITPQRHLAGPDSYDGKFHYCRAAYRQNPRGVGGGWMTDYPMAEIDLSIRLSELTKISVSFDKGGAPKHLIVRLTDDELFQCPVIIMQEVGRLFFSNDEAARLRSYLLKGGFLWVDDFWGSYAWQVWETEIRKVFPATEYPIIDVPRSHALYHTVFELKGVPQIPGIGNWIPGGSTSELGPDSAEVHTRAIVDAHGRIMVLITHNTDVSDSWEREGEDERYFYAFSIDGYRVAVNALIYTMTH